MIRVCMQNNIDQERDEGVRGRIGLFGILQKTKDDLAAIEDADHLISWSPVAINFGQFYRASQTSQKMSRCMHTLLR
jgi:hypothetical protein